jgi:predicted dehydrogenase
MKKTLRWGIIGPGWIAGVFAQAMKDSASGTVVAVASRSPARAQKFAKQHGIVKAYGSYAALCADPAIDVVYIATPHTSHVVDTLAAIKAGKHVLCEKPMGVSAKECQRMVEAAKKAGVVLLEAFMYRVHPQTLKLMALIQAGTIGEIRCVRTAFTFDLSVLPITGHNVREDKTLRGGSLYDVGGYCINASRMIAGCEPNSIHGVWSLDKRSGVDQACAAVLGFPNGVIAHFDIGFHSVPTNFIEVIGAKGRIQVASPWWPDRKRAVILVEKTGKKAQEVVVKNGGWIFTIEADHMAEVIRGTVKPLIPASNAIGTAAVLDTLWQGMHGKQKRSPAKS